nr:uncharacterized protein LOC116774028 [Danaus plexippus plexippus]
MNYVVTPKKKVAEKRKPRIRWWLLNRTMQTNFRAEVERQNLSTNTETAQEVWDRAQSANITGGNRVLGLSKGGWVIDKETWWWNDDVWEVIREKKTAFKEWQQSNSPEDRVEYIAAKRASKRAVARDRSDSTVQAHSGGSRNGDEDAKMHVWCPRKRWLDTVKQDMRANGLTTEDAKDCAKWRSLSRKADPG